MIRSLIGFVVLSGISATLIGLYLLPVLVAWLRHVPDIMAIAVINVLLGWTLFGWVVALALSLRSVTPAVPAVQLFQQLPPPYPPQAGPGGPGLPDVGPPAGPPRRPDAAPPLVLPLRPGEPQSAAEGGDRQWPAQPW
jgi:hypothetical protein